MYTHSETIRTHELINDRVRVCVCVVGKRDGGGSGERPGHESQIQKLGLEAWKPTSASFQHYSHIISYQLHAHPVLFSLRLNSHHATRTFLSAFLKHNQRTSKVDFLLVHCWLMRAISRRSLVFAVRPAVFIRSEDWKLCLGLLFYCSQHILVPKL